MKTEQGDTTTPAPALTDDSVLRKKLNDAAELLDRRPIAHPILQETIKEVHTRIAMARHGTVFLLVGIAGVGVTRVARAVKDLYRRNSHPYNPHSLIEVVARAPINAKFGWKPFFASSLSALDEPVLGQRRRAIESNLRLTAFTTTAQFRGAEDYRTDLQNALLRRNCNVISVIHADFFIRNMRIEETSHVLQLFDQLVSVGQNPRVALLSGRPALLKIIRDDSRVDLCVEVVVVPPFDTTSDKGKKAAIEMLAGFEALISPVIVPNTLIENAQEIVERTVGTTGWVKRAISTAISDVLLLDRVRMIEWSDIRKRLPSKLARERLRSELDEISRWCEHLMTDEHQSPGVTSESGVTAKGRPSGRVGERKSSRDPVGRK